MRLLLILLLLTPSVSCDKDELFIENLNNTEPIELYESIECDEVQPKSIDTTLAVEYYIKKDLLIEAMIWVESRGSDSVVGDGGRAVGCLQIHPIMVREANRILKKDEYTLDDRYSRSKSIEIFYIVNNYHNKDKSYEAIARSWNGGPNWIEKSSTKKYWRKVKRKLKKLYRQNEYSPNRFAEV